MSWRRLRTFPDVSRVELIRHFTLAGADEAFLRKFRTGRNVLGAAVQLCTLPWLGFVPDDVPSAPAAAVGRLSRRLDIPMGELRGYGEREQTRTGHLGEIAAYCGWRPVDASGWKDLETGINRGRSGSDVHPLGRAGRVRSISHVSEAS